MELRDINYFITICNCGSFTRAAQLLYVSQPTLTIAVNRLEKSFDIVLFERGGKKKNTTLTPAGEVLYRRSLDLLTQVEAIKREISAFNQSTVHFGLPQILGAYFFPKIFSEFIENNPQIQVDIRELNALEVISEISNGSLDLGFVTSISDPRYNNVAFKKIGVDTLKLLTPRGHPLAKHTEVDLKETSNEKYILFNKSSNHYRLSQNLFEENGMNPQIFMTSDKIPTVINMVASGLGISLLVNMALEQSKEDVAVVSLKNKAELGIYVCYNSARALATKTKFMLDFILKYTSFE